MKFSKNLDLIIEIEKTEIKVMILTTILVILSIGFSFFNFIRLSDIEKNQQILNSQNVILSNFSSDLRLSIQQMNYQIGYDALYTNFMSSRANSCDGNLTLNIGIHYPRLIFQDSVLKCYKWNFTGENISDLLTYEYRVKYLGTNQIKFNTQYDEKTTVLLSHYYYDDWNATPEIHMDEYCLLTRDIQKFQGQITIGKCANSTKMLGITEDMII